MSVIVGNAGAEPTRKFATIMRRSTATTTLEAVGATDPTGEWKVKDSTNAPAAASGAVQSSSVAFVGDKMGIGWGSVNAAGNEIFYSSSYDVTAETWDDLGAGVRKVQVYSAECGDTTFCALLRRPDGTAGGEWIMIHQYATENVSGAKARIGFSTATSLAGPWTNRGMLKAGGTDHQWCCRAEMGHSNQVYVTFNSYDGTNFNLYLVGIDASNVVGTPIDSTIDLSSQYGIGIPHAARLDSTQFDVHFPINFGTSLLSFIIATTSGGPTISTQTVSTTTAYASATISLAATAHGFGQLVGVSWANSANFDVYWDVNANGVNFGTDLLIASGTDIGHWGDIYDRNGPKLGFLQLTNPVGWVFTEYDNSTINILTDVAMADRQANTCGPFKRSDGTGFDIVVRNQLRERILVMISLTRTSTASAWTDFDELTFRSNNIPFEASQPTQQLRAHHSMLVGDDIYIFTHMESGDLDLSIVNNATRRFSVRRDPIARYNSTNWGYVSESSVDAILKANGTFVVASTYLRPAITGGTFRIFTGTLGSWTNQGIGGLAENAGYCICPRVIGEDSNGLVTFCFKDTVGALLYANTINSSYAIGAPFAVVSSDIASARSIVGEPLMVGDQCRMPYLTADGKLAVATWTAVASAPTVTLYKGLSVNSIYHYNTSDGSPDAIFPAVCFGLITVNGKTAAWYIGTDQDIYLVPDVFGAPGVEMKLVTATVRKVSAVWNTPVIDYIYDDNGTVKYGQAALYDVALQATTTPVATLVKQTGKPLRANNPPVASLVRQTGRPLRATNPAVASLQRAISKSLQATNPAVATLVRQTAKALQATTAPVARLVLQTGKIIRASNPAVATMTYIQGRAIAASTAPVASLQRAMSKSLQATTAPVARVVKTIGKRLQASTAPVASLAKATTFRVFLQATANVIASLLNTFRRGLLGILPVNPSLTGTPGATVPGLEGRVASSTNLEGES